MSSDGIENAFDQPEPDLPLTFVPCRFCGQMVPLRAPACDECGGARPQRVVLAPRCEECGDTEYGPWLERDGRTICEPCDDRRAA